MSRNCPKCQREVECSPHVGLLADRCPACGFTRPAVEVETEFWIKVPLRSALTATQLRAVRAADPQGTDESAQSFVSRIRDARELRLGPFWLKPRALDAMRRLAQAGLEPILDV